MPSLPLDEPNDEDPTNYEVIRDVARSAVAAAAPKEVGRRPWLALVVLLVVVATNPHLAAILAGSLALLYLAVDLTRVGGKK